MAARSLLITAIPVLLAGAIAAATEAATGVNEPVPGPPSLSETMRGWLRSAATDDGAEAIREAIDGKEDVAISAALDSETSTVMAPSDLLSESELANAEPWRAPDYEGQTGALGWSETLFEVPEGLKDRVAFWLDIYTKYTTDQGVIHDKMFIDHVYATVDFGPIMRDPTKNIFQKEKLRKKLVDDKKAEIASRIRRLHGRKTPEGLEGEDLRYWKLFETVKDADKFVEGSQPARIRFQQGQRDRFILGIFHSGRYLREMEKIFREEGLPVEITRLPFVESSFNIRARSRVGASGIWQFMPRTARQYMKIGRDIDERNDPWRATQASARLLRQNYMMLKSWPLALTGYNHGPYGIRAIVNKTGTNDIVQIIRTYSSRSFGFASENFYACFLAALEAEKNARKYFGNVKWGQELAAVELRATRSMPYKTLLEIFDRDESALELANPHFTSVVRTGRASIPAGTFIRVPSGRQKVAEDLLSGRLKPTRLASILRETPLQRPPPTVIPAGTVPVSGH